MIPECRFVITCPERSFSIDSKKYPSNKAFTEAAKGALKKQAVLSEEDEQVFSVFCQFVKNNYHHNVNSLSLKANDK